MINRLFDHSHEEEVSLYFYLKNLHMYTISTGVQNTVVQYRGI